MRPKSTIEWDERTFGDLKETACRASQAHKYRYTNPAYAASAPKDVTLQLTQACNLRCRHCFQWSPEGYHRGTPSTELALTAIENVFRNTRESKADIYLWGGEPLLHSEWDAVTQMLARDPRRTFISTNGLLLDDRLLSLLPISGALTTIISLDGFERQHDAVRGRGTFHCLERNIRLLSHLRETGEYRGGLVLSCCLSDDLIPDLYAFTEYCESLACDRIIYGFPWYIPEDLARQMDVYYRENFGWLGVLGQEHKASWHCFTCHLDPGFTEALRGQILRMKARVWNIRVGFHPVMALEEMESVVRGEEHATERPRPCLGVANRISIFADGTVSFCANFPEFCLGNIYTEDLAQIWHSERFRRVREIRNTKLMPAALCRRCRCLSENPP